MPSVTLPVQPDGLAISVLIGLDAGRSHARLAAGQSLPRPRLFRAVVDTGADATAIDARVAQALGIQPSGSALTHTALGPAHVSFYDVSLSLLPSPQSMPFFVEPQLIVTELAQSIPNYDALIGLNVLLQLIFTLDGPARTFTLTC